jgi:DNA-binding GntR family transcriptional regulator
MLDTTEVHPSARRSAADRVYDHAKEGLLSRRYPAHELLCEGDLAEAVGVSRTPVREALLRLQAEGLVRLIPKRGALVLPVTADEVADVLEARRMIESHAARAAVTHSGSELVSRLESHVQRMRAAMRAHDARAYAEADRDFHEAIVAAAHNAILTDWYRSLRDRQLRMGVVNLLDRDGADLDPKRLRATIAEHQAILDAIAARSVRAAEAAVAEHLDRAEHLLTR